MENPEVTMKPELQAEMAKYAVEVNKEIAELIGIPQASRVTCVKPEGSTSVLLNTGSGIHPRFGRKYFRRVQANKNDPILKAFKALNPYSVEHSQWSTNNTDDMITFCVEAPETAIIGSDLTALELLKAVKDTQNYWVKNGTALPERSPNLLHNVSNTITVREEEREEVARYIYDNRAFFTGVSMVAPDADFVQAPHELVDTPDKVAKWNEIVSNFTKVDYTAIKEEEDNTEIRKTVACAGGTCQIL